MAVDRRRWMAADQGTTVIHPPTVVARSLSHTFVCFIALARAFGVSETFSRQSGTAPLISVMTGLHHRVTSTTDIDRGQSLERGSAHTA
jgi:hypothetical protein